LIAKISETFSSELTGGISLTRMVSSGRFEKGKITSSSLEGSHIKFHVSTSIQE
jgi:hypothetical protein